MVTKNWMRCWHSFDASQWVEFASGSSHSEPDLVLLLQHCPKQSGLIPNSQGFCIDQQSPKNDPQVLVSVLKSCSKTNWFSLMRWEADFPCLWKYPTTQIPFASCKGLYITSVVQLFDFDCNLWFWIFFNNNFYKSFRNQRTFSFSFKKGFRNQKTSCCSFHERTGGSLIY